MANDVPLGLVLRVGVGGAVMRGAIAWGVLRLCRLRLG